MSNEESAVQQQPIRISVDRSGLGSSDFWLLAPPDMRVAEVARRALPGRLEFRSLMVDGRPCQAEATIQESGLRAGSLLSVDTPVTSAPTTGVVGAAWRLRGIEGPVAGRVLDLTSGTFDVGRSRSCPFSVADPDLSRRHLSLHVTDDRVQVRDLGSTNGTFVDGVRCGQAWVDVGEGAKISAGACSWTLTNGLLDRAAVSPDGRGGRVLNRTYRIRQPLQPVKVEWPRTPAQAAPVKRAFPWAAALIPLLAGVALAAFTRQPSFLLFALLSPLTMWGSQWSENRVDRQRREEALAEYGLKGDEAQRHVDQAMAAEGAALRESFPSPAETIDIVRYPLARLWERRPEDDDFMAVRLGVGSRPSRVSVDAEKDARLPSLLLSDAPITVDLLQSPVLGIAGPPARTTKLAAWLTFQAAALHSPDDLRIVLLSDGAQVNDWGLLRWLPHATDETDGSVAIGVDRAGIDARIKELTALVENRAAASRRYDVDPTPARPRYLVVAESIGELRRSAAVATLLRDAAEVGISIVCTATDPRLLPEECTSAAILQSDGCLTLSGPGTDGVDAVITDEFPVAQADRASRTLANMHRVAGAGSAALPTAARLLDVLGMPDPRGEAVWLNWRAQPSQTAALVGRSGDGDFVVDIARDGPHILVAGTTGSGKSEFLQTLIASLATVNSPEALSFLFIDFKGGPTFRDFEALPHCVGLVTNLDGPQVTRALQALRAELDRRQRQLNDAGADDIVDYLKRHSRGQALGPFPRLMIVIDEFAEMKEQLPDFLDSLVSIARTGRSLGVHLVLATQRPHGVVSPEIRSNANLRVCLRVREASDSVDILDDPRAAEIPRSVPGRALASVGGEAPIAFQTARVKGKYRESAGAPEPFVEAAPWEAAASPAPLPPQAGSEVEDLARLVSAIVEACKTDGRHAPYRPWTPPLPQRIGLDELTASGDGRSARSDAILGLADLPDQQRQDPWRVRLGQGHLAIIGSPGSGRTTALRTLAASATSNLPVADLNMWAIDGGQGLRALTNLPHVGAVVEVGDAGLTSRLIERLNQECARRLSFLAEQGLGDALEQRACAAPLERLPLMVLLLDKWEAFYESYATTDLADQFDRLLSDGGAAGLTVAIAGDEMLLRGRALTRIATRLVLPLHDPAAAMAAGVDHRRVAKENMPGRGVTSTGVAVQVALLDAGTTRGAQDQALQKIISTAAERERRQPTDQPRQPFRLRPLPERVHLRDLPLPPRGIRLAVGGDEPAPVMVSERTSILVVGPHGSGRTTTLLTICAELSRAGVAVDLVAVPSVAIGPAHPEGIRFVDRDSLNPAGWGALLRPGESRAVVIDDLEKVMAPELTELLARPDRPTLVLASELSQFAFPGSSLRAAMQVCATRIVLCPTDHLAAQHVGLMIQRGRGFTGPPGRGFLVQGSLQTPVQVARPE